MIRTMFLACFAFGMCSPAFASVESTEAIVVDENGTKSRLISVKNTSNQWIVGVYFWPVSDVSRGANLLGTSGLAPNQERLITLPFEDCMVHYKIDFQLGGSYCRAERDVCWASYYTFNGPTTSGC